MRMQRRSRGDEASCREVRRVLHAFLDGEIAVAEADRVAAHLAHCERCGIAAETFQQVKDALAQLRPDLDEAALVRLRSFVDDVTAEAAG